VAILESSRPIIINSGGRLVGVVRGGAEGGLPVITAVYCTVGYTNSG
jgi:hypothetical protein